MDIHRCRFVPYPASSINALAFSHSPASKDNPNTSPNLRLSIGRANGNIEIWNPQKGNWFQECILRGGKERSIEGLAWTHDLEGTDQDGNTVPGRLRLFSVGYSTAITEWDLALGKPVRHSGGNYGEIWCMAAQPRWQARHKPAGKSITLGEEVVSNQILAVGCADGTIVLHSTADGDLRFLKTLVRSSGKKSRVLCLAFLGRGKVVAGYADSTIRIFSIRNGRQLSSMSLGAGQPDGPSEILVWSVKCTPDGTIISGDSTGEVRFWDGQNFTLLQRIKSHKEDILDLAVSADGSIIFSAGMDRRTTMYRRIADPTDKKGNRWAEMSHQRHHSHDVKTMAVYESNDLSIVASGGVDAAPMIIPLKKYGKENVRSLPMFPNDPPVQSAPSKRLLMSWWNRNVFIWRVEGMLGGGPENGEARNPNQSRKLVGKILLKGEENISSASLGPRGDLLAISTMSEVNIFHLRAHKSAALSGLKVSKTQSPSVLTSHGARLVRFSPDSKWLLVIRGDNSIHLHRVINSSDPVGKPHVSHHTTQISRVTRDCPSPKPVHGTHGDYEKNITRAAWSSDSRILVVSDLSGNLDSWVLEGYEDLTQDADVVMSTELSHTVSDEEDDETPNELSHPTIILGQHWIPNPQAKSLPRLPSCALVMSFRPTESLSPEVLTNGHTMVHPTRHNPHPHSHDLPHGEDRLFVLTSLHKVYEYRVLAGRLSHWSRRNPPSVLPQEFRNVRDRAMDCVWDVGGGRERVWLYGTSWLWMFDLAKDMSATEQAASRAQPLSEGVLVNTEKLSKKRKRKMLPQETRDLIKDTTGAGSMIPDEELHSGIGNRLRKTTGVEQKQSLWISIEQKPSRTTAEDAEDDESEGENMSALVSSRRTVRDQTHSSRPANGEGANDGELLTNGDADLPGRAGQDLSYWYTWKYRPILGIVPFATSMSHGGDGHESRVGIEVGIVERPLWDVDLPPRYHGDQEWEK